MSLEKADRQAETVDTADSVTESDTADTDELEALRRENAHLRQRYEQLQQGQYRQTALALFVLGVLGLGGAALVPPVREILIVLGAIGLFSAAVTRYLSPEQFIPAGIGSSVFQAHASNHDAVVDELGLQDTRVYIPHGERETVRLFVPEHRSYRLPAPSALRDTFVITDDEAERGVALTPAGVGLFDEFEQSRDGPLGDQPKTLARQSTDALVELFELVDTATAETDSENGRMTVRVTDCTFASATTFDTPVASFVGVTLARGLDKPIAVEISAIDETDFAVTCRWESTEEFDEPES